MAKLSILGVLSNVQMLFFSLRKGKFVGEDHMGNRYYRGKPIRNTKRERRWVMYKGKPEASAIPPEWHGWIHHQTDEVPVGPRKKTPYRQKWQKQHEPNHTGTAEAYFPPGHATQGGARDAATGDYTAWTPPK